MAVEKYRNRAVDPSEIRRDLDVNYWVEGSVQKNENEVRLIVQLISTLTGKQVWTTDNIREWNNIFKVQSEIASAIAKEIEIKLSPEEKQDIEIALTSNLDAYDFYLRARHEHNNWFLRWAQKDKLDHAIRLYKNALELDSTFAAAYAGIGSALYARHLFPFTDKTNVYLDSILYFANKALSLDNKQAEAYLVRGLYYEYKEINPQKALEEINRGLTYDPAHYQAYFFKANILTNDLGRYLEAIQDMHRAIGRKPGIEMQEMIWRLSVLYGDIGFYDKAKYFLDEYYKVTGGKPNYLANLMFIEQSYGHYTEAIKYAKEILKMDSSKLPGFYIRRANYSTAICYQTLGQYKEAHRYFLKASIPWNDRVLGYSYWRMGYKEEAIKEFNICIEGLLNSIEIHDWGAEHTSTHFDLAMIYAVIGEKEKAYKYLEEIKKRHCYPQWWVTLIKDEPMFESIRSEHRFQEIVRHVEEKFQNEHNKVRDWLKKEDML
jgi:tetratricopeptide (TPR) repeat protein